jgi:cell division protein FtsQ
MTAARIRPRRLVRRLALPRPGPRTLAAVVAVLVLGVGAYLWFRDSSFVTVKKVTITGVSGPDAGRIRSALESAARNMTTLDVKMDQLHTAVGPYPLVKELRVTTQFPHGMRIRVIEEIPVAEVALGGRDVAVASDGTLLHDAGPTPQLPLITLRAPPGGTRLTQQDGLPLVALLAAAPYALLSHISQASSTGEHGFVAQLRNGPSIYFGDGTRMAAKWTAASEVLASAGSAGAEYIDVTDPDRPVAGAAAPAATTSTTSTGDASTAAIGGTSTTPTAGTSITPTAGTSITPATTVPASTTTTPVGG